MFSPQIQKQGEIIRLLSGKLPLTAVTEAIGMAEAGKGGSRLNAEDTVQVQSCQDPWDSLTCWTISPTGTEPGVHTAAGQSRTASMVLVLIAMCC